MKKILYFALLFILLPSLALAQVFPEPQDKYVNDFAGFLDQQTISDLRTLLSSLEQNTTAEVVVVTVNTTEPLPPSQYRTELFNTWHIGKKEKDNGLLILYAVKEKRIEVEVGYGLEGILPDSKVGRILDDYYVPYRDKGETVRGIFLATLEFARVINENADEVRAGNAGKSVWSTDFLLMAILPFILILVALPLIFIYIDRHPKCNICGERMKYERTEGDYEIFICKNGHILRRKKRKQVPYYVPGAGGGFGGSSGSSGGGGFGGGSSGGGGAGR